MDTAAPVRTDRLGAVGIIELARPAKFNCLNSAVMDGIAAALSEFEQDRAVRVLLLQSTGKHFCSGAELDEVEARRRDPAGLAAFLQRGHAVLKALEASRLPVVSAVQGLCLAGGLELMLACDVVFAAKSARIGDQHAQFGLVPGWGGSQRLTRIVGLRRALDLFFSARWLSADEALAWGLLNHVVDDDKLHSEALAYCTTLATRSTSGLAMMKRLARDGLEQSLAAGLDMEIKLATELLAGSADVTEGLAAFQERRPPNFS